MNPQPPKLYSLIKLHKIDRPIRPVVSFTTAPSVKLSKKLDGKSKYTEPVLLENHIFDDNFEMYLIKGFN